MVCDIRFCQENITIVVLIRSSANMVFIRHRAFLLHINAPDTVGVVDEQNRVIFQKELDTGHIIAADFIHCII